MHISKVFLKIATIAALTSFAATASAAISKENCNARSNASRFAASNPKSEVRTSTAKSVKTISKATPSKQNRAVK